MRHPGFFICSAFIEALKHMQAPLMVLLLGLFFAPLTFAQQIKYENGTWYEYADKITTPYKHIMQFHNTAPTGPSDRTAPTRATLDRDWEDAVKEADKAWFEKMTGLGYTICDPGKLEKTTTGSLESAENGAEMRSAGRSSVVLWSGQPSRYCHPDDVTYLSPGLVTSHLSWQYTCPHGFFAFLSGGNLICRRPLDYCPDSCGNPITHTSSKIQPELDYRSADGLLEVTRTYNSARLPKPGWANTYESRINFDGTYAIVNRPNGSRLYFKYDGAGFIPMQSTTAKLSISSTGFNFVTADDRTESYLPQGDLTRITYRDGKSIDVSRMGGDGAQVVKVTDLYGRQLQMYYKQSEWGDGQTLQTMVLPDGGSIQYTNASTTGTLLTATYPDQKTRTYQYGATEPTKVLRLTGIIDENNVAYASFGYGFYSTDIDTTSMHAGGVERYEIRDGRYANGTGSVTVIEPLGATSTHQYANINGVSRLVSTSQAGRGTSTVTYDTKGNVASRTDSKGNLTRYTYDPARNLETSRTEGLTSGGATTSVTRITETTWHPTFNLPTRIIEKDTNGTAVRQTDTAYDNKGNKTSQSVKDINANKTRTTTWAYIYSNTVPGHVERLVINGPRTDVQDITTIDYWPADAACEGSGTGQDKGCRGQIKTIADALGKITSYTAYDANSRPLSIVEPNGLVTTLAYSPRGWLTTKTTGSETTAYDYDGAGQLKKVTLPDASSISYTHDDAHRLTDVTDSLGNNIHYTLDVMGNRTKEEIKDPNGVLAGTATRVYDVLNRLQQTICGTLTSTAQSAITSYQYDGNDNITQITDPLGHITNQSYDALNRLKQQLQPAPVSGAARPVINYTYDGLDQLLSVTDPRNLTTTYTVDGLGNRTVVASPDTGTTGNTYDEAGNLKTSTDAKGQTTSYTYDALNRLTRIAYADSSAVDYQYDQGSNGLGRLTKIIDSSGTIQYAYDQQGRAISETRTIGGTVYVTGYTYDNAGCLVSITYPSGRILSYLRDPMGRISQIDVNQSGQTKNLISQVTYRPFGGVQSFHNGAGQTLTRSTDLDGRTTSYTLHGQPQLVSYDAASRIISIWDTANANNLNNYGYDDLDRLTQINSPGGNQTYGYDATGNRTSRGLGSGNDSYATSQVSNRLTQLSGPSGTRLFAYDGNGSITDNGLSQFTYDARGRLTSANTALGPVQYKINALGQRVQKIAPQGSTFYHYDRDGKLIAESMGGGVFVKEYVYLNDIPVAVLTP